MTLSVASLQKRVAAMRRKAPHARPWFGIRSREPWAGPDEIVIDGNACRVVQVDSPLAARSAILDAGEGRWLVLVTQLEQVHLGAEFVAKLALRRLESIHPWTAVKDALQVSTLDPRLADMSWMAEALLEVNSDRLKPLAAGVLDLDSAWAVLVEDLAIPGARPDTTGLIEWSAKASDVARWRAWPPEQRLAFKVWCAELGGAATGRVFEAIENGNAADLVPIGLVLDALWRAMHQRDEKADAAAVRAEKFFSGSKPLDRVEMRELGSAAIEVLRRERSDGIGSSETIKSRAEELLRVALLCPELAEYSDWLTAGFEQRLESFGNTLLRYLDAAKPDREDELRRALKVLGAHRATGGDVGCDTRVLRAEMSCRLARWLAAREETTPATLEALATRYRDDGAWVDRARHFLLDGEAQGTAASAYRKLLARVLDAREIDTRAFAQSLAEITARGMSRQGLVGIEDLLDRVVAPLAKEQRAVLLVMDGMSVAIAQQVAESIESTGSWRRHAPAGEQGWPVVLSALPSVTEASRCSLLCGSLSSGEQTEEVAGFERKAAAHGWRRKATKTQLLFHKADLTPGLVPDLDSSIEQALDSDARVIAVVVNAVDDLLSKGSQIRADWSLKGVPVLERLVHHARESGRVIVLTSDHGHVVESGSSEPRKMREHERWREDDGTLHSDEVRVEGARVVLPKSGGPCVLPASELVRYAPKRGGYHGGATPQEVVVPLAVLVPAGVDVAGWAVETVDPPGWWRLDSVEAPKPATRIAKPDAAQRKPDLFTAVEAKPREGEWIDQLLASPTYVAQLKFAGRTPPRDDDMRSLIQTLDSNRGTLTFAALGAKLAVSAVQLNGRLTVARRVLNVDGYDVLDVADGGQTVRLNYELLAEQFQIAKVAR